MSWLREWLEGGDAAASSAGERRAPGDVTHAGGRVTHAGGPVTETDAPPRYPGERLGLPETGPGSVATLARRGAQFALDAVLAGLVASLFTYPALPQNWSLLAWAVLMLVPVAVVGATPSMVLLGVRVVRLDRPEAMGVGPLWALVRTASVFFVVPALIVDTDSRGIQDRASRTVVVRTR